MSTRHWIACIAVLGGAGACTDERPPVIDTSGTPGLGSNGDGEGEGGDGGDGPGIDLTPGRPIDPGCGSDFVPIVVERPNIYFLLDRSGSMVEALDDQSTSKYAAANVAIVDVLSRIGHRVNYGAAVFPDADFTCSNVGAFEVRAVAPGDPLSEDIGPSLASLRRAINTNFPNGGATPTAAAVSEVRSQLAALEGDTVLVLATDGVPNCADLDSCPSDQCGEDLFRTVLQDGRVCGQDVNCCTPDVLGAGSCIDRTAATAVRGLQDDGITTYVIGLPSAEGTFSDAFDDVLNDLAVAGGAPRDGQEKYYSGADSDALAASLTSIGLDVAANCVQTLSGEPENPNLVNVYLDGQLVRRSDPDGWQWVGDDYAQLELVGDACTRLKTGQVLELQIIYGCPTELF